MGNAQPSMAKAICNRTSTAKVMTKTELPMTTPVNSFGYDILKAINNGDENNNIFFSAISISSAFSILLAGAKGKTEKELRQGLKFGHRSQKEIHEQFGQVMALLCPRGASENSYDFNMANKIVLAQGNSISPVFKDIVATQYRASLDEVDFAHNGEAVLQQINQWVSESTHGKIQNIYEKPAPPATILIILNAIYFKGTWASPFDKEQNLKMPFFNNGLVQKETEFMFKESEYKTARSSDQTFEAIEIPYNGNVSMVVILPDNKDGLDQVLMRNSFEDLQNTFDSCVSTREREAELFLPKFKLESEYDLIPIMQKLDVIQVFEPTRSNLENIGRRQLWVDDARHKAFVEVDEVGTTAAGVTAIRAVCLCETSHTPVYKIDHPFLFFIRDNETGLNLFTGRVNNL